MILFWIATSGFAHLATDDRMLLESTLFAEPRIACCHLRLAFTLARRHGAGNWSFAGKAGNRSLS